jgi:glycosyltransferase involved in cell wall biosynthesis
MISVIIPAYNEASRIARTIDKLTKELSKKDEIIVVADGQDSTANIARKNSRAHVLQYDRRLGKGGALIEGIRFSHGSVIVFCDADYCCQEYVSIKILTENLSDINIGSRYSTVAVRGSLKRKLFSRLFNLAVRIFFSLNLKDTQCGFKAFRREVLEAIVPETKTKGFAFDIDLLWLAKKHGYSIKEIPVHWDYLEDSKASTVRIAFEMLREIFALRFIS